MKKVMLCAVALLFGAIGFAQVTDADGNASPNATVVGALPGSAAGANTGLSIQNGNANKVRVRQAGTSQSVYTEQDDGSTGVGGNQAFVRQTGAVSAASGVANKADVRQSGETNESRTLQEGDANEAVTQQGQTDDLSANNKSLIRQGIANQAQNNYAAVTQDGSGNQATTTQIADNSDAWTIQDGVNNKSMINQNATPNLSDGHYAMNQQIGEGNESFIGQNGDGARNTANALQNGNFNQSKQYQTATAGTGGTGNTAGVVQGGSVGQGNLIASESIDQWINVRDNVDADANTIWYDPPTEYNDALQVQVGVDNSAGIFQIGGNVAGSSYAEQNQTGTSNNAGIAQAHHSDGEPSSYGKQNQTGTENTAGLVQTGSSNKSMQNQSGSLNISLASQRGEHHMLNTNQFGDQNVAYAAQHGDCNAALITQYGGQSYTVEQNKGLDVFDLSGGGNQADILQMGPDGDFGAGYIECSFDAPVDLDMDYTVPDLNLPDICPDCD